MDTVKERVSTGVIIANKLKKDPMQVMMETVNDLCHDHVKADMHKALGRDKPLDFSNISVDVFLNPEVALRNFAFSKKFKKEFRELVYIPHTTGLVEIDADEMSYYPYYSSMDVPTILNTLCFGVTFQHLTTIPDNLTAEIKEHTKDFFGISELYVDLEVDDDCWRRERTSLHRRILLIELEADPESHGTT